MTVDVLAVGPHPDDAELGVGGTLHKIATRGFAAAILDLTEGETASRGTTGERRTEAQNAAHCLGLAARVQAGLPDGGVVNTPEQRRTVLMQIRALRPRMLLAPSGPERHPDHTAAHGLVRDANFFAGVAGIDTGQEPYRAPTVYFYFPYYQPVRKPALVVDISEHLEAKLTALRAYVSQFHNPEYAGAKTWVASKQFWDAIVTRAAYWGEQVGVRHGEPLYADDPFGCDLPPGLSGGRE